jgi:hypothetical protein
MDSPDYKYTDYFQKEFLREKGGQAIKQSYYPETDSFILTEASYEYALRNHCG